MTVFTLSDDSLTSCHFLLIKGISKLASLIWLHSLKNGHLFKELLVFVTATLSSILHDVIESVTVEFPQKTVLVSLDRGSSRCIVEQSELAEGLSWLVLFEQGWLSFAWEDL